MFQSFKSKIKKKLTLALKDDLIKCLEPNISQMAVDAYREKFHTVSLAVVSTVYNQIEGDYLEFGVREGESFIRAYLNYADARERLLGNPYLQDTSNIPPAMRFFAFDAFEKGLPDESSLTAKELRPAQWGVGSMKASQSTFIENCIKSGIPQKQLFCVPGYFDKSLTTEVKHFHKIEKAAVLHFDCDLYESTKVALDFSTDLIQLGTVIIFDDYFRYRGSEKHGEYYAFEEWKAKNPQFAFRELSRFGETAVSYICSKSITT